MKLNLSCIELAKLMNANLVGDSQKKLVDVIVYDTRKILDPSKSAFIALKGEHRDGHKFIQEAYKQGVKIFVVSEDFNSKLFPNACFLLVKDTLKALQLLAQKHRENFKLPVIGITGSVGKTTIKEWIYFLLNDNFNIVRSPKSFNSQLGVALSLLEINETHELAIIEVGISQPNEMDSLQKMIAPTIGIFTAFGSAHAHNFTNEKQHLTEKLKLFISCNEVFVANSISADLPNNYLKVNPKEFNSLLKESPFQDKASLENLALVFALAQKLNIDLNEKTRQIKELPRLALRMETFKGKNGNTIINDSYNADLDALIQSLEYQKSLASTKKRTAIIGVEGLSDEHIKRLQKTLANFELDACFYVKKNELPPIENLHQQVILIKGTRLTQIQRIANLFQLKKHKTRIEINLSVLKENLLFWKNQVSKNCKLLVMVKANAYGAGSEKITEFLEKNGVAYFGVAYADEGVELRKSGIKTPILVMNAEEEAFQDLIDYNLEPAIYSFSILDSFIKKLIDNEKEQFPIHIKMDTGMRRLGFEVNDVNKLLDCIQTQPEVKIKSVYSHLAESDKLEDESFTRHQIQLFEQISTIFNKRVSNQFDKHLLNSEGIFRFPEAQFDMVRLGIGLYGMSVNPTVKSQIKQVITWKSVVSQIKSIAIGESVGYSRTFIADKPTKIAIIPVGYADGFKRSLGNGNGGVYIQNEFCPVVGNVCMDMIMVNVTNLPIKEGDEVEIIGENQSIESLAKAMQTIPYEVLTSLSKRLHRVYIEE